jgi:hypothetical protein
MAVRGSSRFLFATILAILAGAGTVHGLLSDRWRQTPSPTQDSLERLPETIGDWVGSPAERAPDELPGGTDGPQLLRHYVNRRAGVGNGSDRMNGAAVTVFLTVGRPGPIIASHSPESCYPGAGFTCVGEMTKHKISTGPDNHLQEFWVASFSKKERASPIHVRVFWSWSAAGNWQVPQYPRLEFARKPRLFKLYVIRQMLKEREPIEDDPIIHFIRAAAPELEKMVLADGI